MNIEQLETMYVTTPRAVRFSKLRMSHILHSKVFLVAQHRTDLKADQAFLSSDARTQEG
jgi:hypothetical protein